MQVMQMHANAANYNYKNNYKNTPNPGQHSLNNSSSGLWKSVEMWKTFSVSPKATYFSLAGKVGKSAPGG